MKNAKGIRVIDEVNLFNGPLDYYNWEIVGKKEKLTPYNNVILRNSVRANEYADLLTPHHIKSDLTERHRVWVIKATLKPDKRHIYSKRYLYIDEDSWSILMTDMYDAQDRLIRTSTRYCVTSTKNHGIQLVIDYHNDLE